MTSRKNWTMRAAVLMLALVLITSCFVGGTFAKYVTSESGSDTARVAKFGVNINATTGMFSKEYAKDDTSFTLAANTVVSSNDDKLVAPGTSQNMAEFGLTGTPEVAVRVSYELKKFELTKWTTNGTDEYCPLVFIVNGTEIKMDDTNTTVAKLQDAVIAAVNSYSKEYAANTDLSQQTNDNLEISWRWDFHTSDANDIKDTALGDRAAANAADAGKIDIVLAATVTQID